MSFARGSTCLVIPPQVMARVIASRKHFIHGQQRKHNTCTKQRSSRERPHTTNPREQQRRATVQATQGEEEEGGEESAAATQSRGARNNIRVAHNGQFSQRQLRKCTLPRCLCWRKPDLPGSFLSTLDSPLQGFQEAFSRHLNNTRKHAHNPDETITFRRKTRGQVRRRSALKPLSSQTTNKT
jgi:hypothetical protein